MHCADLGLDVEWADLGAVRRGEYRHLESLIVLNRSLTASQAASTLVHELGHHKFGDTCSTPAGERRAWEYGASMLISPAEYRRAERLAGHHPAGLAIELGVTPRLIDAWRAWWHKQGRWLHPELTGEIREAEL